MFGPFKRPRSQSSVPDARAASSTTANKDAPLETTAFPGDDFSLSSKAPTSDNLASSADFAILVSPNRRAAWAMVAADSRSESRSPRSPRSALWASLLKARCVSGCSSKADRVASETTGPVLSRVNAYSFVSPFAANSIRSPAEVMMPSNRMASLAGWRSSCDNVPAARDCVTVASAQVPTGIISSPPAARTGSLTTKSTLSPTLA